MTARLESADVAVAEISASPTRLRYPTYRSSGVEWLGQVPEHWSRRKLGYITSIQGGGTPSKDNPAYWNGSIPWVSPKDMKRRIIDDTIDHVTEDAVCETTLGLIDRPAVLIVVRGMILSHTFPVGVTTVPVTINQDMKAISARSEALAEFLTYLLQGIAPAFLALVEESGHGTKCLRTDLWKGLELFIPPLEEQQAIAAFLDWETARIDELVAKKQRLIELLAEKRTALISHAVTKGLDPDAPMKDSGIDWLGSVPEHWTIKRLRFILASPLQYGANESAELDEPSLPRYIRITDINDDGTLRDDTFRSLPEELANPYLLQPGDLLFARSGATVGKTFLYDESWGRAAYAGYLIRARFDRKRMLPRFVAFYTVSLQYRQWLSASVIQATIQNVSAEKYANLCVPVPPLPEQTTIAAFLDRETGRIDGLVDKVREAIDKLREYRSALISAAVTGKIDVRGEV